jgi:hypothetical protein
VEWFTKGGGGEERETKRKEKITRDIHCENVFVEIVFVLIEGLIKKKEKNKEREKERKREEREKKRKDN